MILRIKIAILHIKNYKEQYLLLLNVKHHQWKQMKRIVQSRALLCAPNNQEPFESLHIPKDVNSHWRRSIKKDVAKETMIPIQKFVPLQTSAGNSMAAIHEWVAFGYNFVVVYYMENMQYSIHRLHDASQFPQEKFTASDLICGVL